MTEYCLGIQESRYRKGRITRPSSAPLFSWLPGFLSGSSLFIADGEAIVGGLRGGRHQLRVGFEVLEEVLHLIAHQDHVVGEEHSARAEEGQRGLVLGEVIALLGIHE